MELHFTPEHETFVDAVNRGEEALQKGAFLTHEQVGLRLQHFLQPDGGPLAAARGDMV